MRISTNIQQIHWYTVVINAWKVNGYALLKQVDMGVLISCLKKLQLSRPAVKKIKKMLETSVLQKNAPRFWFFERMSENADECA